MSIRAIIFDSNAFGKEAMPNVSTVERWAQACHRHDAELWIPEPVALELAEHAIAAAREFSRTFEAHNSRRKGWGFRTYDLPPEPSAEEVLERLQVAGAELIEVSGDAAKDALRDQILITGPASLKDGTKTGAADSAWTRAVFEANGDSSDGLIVVTNDARARGFLVDVLGFPDSAVVPTLGAIRGLLSETTEASESDVAKFFEALPDIGDGAGGAFPLNELDPDWLIRAARSRFRTDVRWEPQSVESKIIGREIIGPADYDAWSMALTARVRFEIEVYEHFLDLESAELVLVDGFNIVQVEGDVAVTCEDDWYEWTEFENVLIVD